MSNVSSMLLMVCALERTAIEQLNEWCRERDTERQQVFEKIDMDECGGWKSFQQDVYACAGNHFPWRDLVESLPSFDWEFPENVVFALETDSELESYVYVVGDLRGCA